MKFGGFDRANRWVDGGGLVAWRSSSAEQALISPRLLCTGRLLCSARGAEQGRDGCLGRQPGAELFGLQVSNIRTS